MVEIISAHAGEPVIIGGGLAGLITALRLAPMPVTVLVRHPLGVEAASAWAQGGVAAALGEDDAPPLHAADTRAAGDGLCDPAVVERVTMAAPAAIEALTRMGVRFERDAEGRLALGLEAAHSRRRIAHAGGDATGREIMRAVIRTVSQTPSIAVVSGVEARRIIVKDGEVHGVLAAAASRYLALPTRRLVMATGGAAALYRHTTNPLGAIGSGLALAARAGAALVDMEFVQFHPTGLDGDRDPMPLVSEAVRGEGAVLIDERGERFMAGLGRAELEPRDIVARAVWRHMARGHQVFLDARTALGPRFAERFPGIAASCRAAGIDPATSPIPVKPSAHYHMGGIAVDEAGRSSLKGLWACGEAASTSLHGANRLASNSLLEAIVYGGFVAESIIGTQTSGIGRLAPRDAPPAPDAAPVRAILSRHVGVERDRAGLVNAIDELHKLAFSRGSAAEPALVGLFIAVAALTREESRGAHYRTDFPRTSSLHAQRRKLDLAAVAALAGEVRGDMVAFAFGD
ncbi:L-aspartate oxidase [Rhizobiales bacterium GAS188]|nr:L-aspartate oxidase [Rhizobiales bacterium GAS188]